MPGSRATTVEVNGYAGRALRKARLLEVDEIATKMKVTRDYLYKIELGYSRRVSLAKFRAWQDALGVDDQRALMAHPHEGNGSGGGA